MEGVGRCGGVSARALMVVGGPRRDPRQNRRGGVGLGWDSTDPACVPPLSWMTWPVFGSGP